MSDLSSRILNALDEAVAAEVGARLRQAAQNVPPGSGAPALSAHFEQDSPALKMLDASERAARPRKNAVQSDYVWVTPAYILPITVHAFRRNTVSICSNQINAQRRRLGDPVEIRVDGVAEHGERDEGLALKKRAAKFLLQRDNGIGQRGLGNAAAFGRTGEITLAPRVRGCHRHRFLRVR